MRLLFAYFDFYNHNGLLKPYRGFEQGGLNLSTDKVFSVEKNDGVYYLRSDNKQEDQQLRSGFWGDDRIYNVTALVGNNGAGKTTILHELIKACTLQGEERNSNFILVVEKTRGPQNEGLAVYTNIERIMTTNIEKAEIVRDYPNFMKKLKIMLLDNTLSVSDIELAGEYRCYCEDRNNYSNVSTLYDQLYNVTTVSSIEYSAEISRARLLSPMAFLDTYFKYETYQQLRFVFESRNRKKLFELRDAGYSVPVPTRLRIIINKIYSDVVTHETFTTDDLLSGQNIEVLFGENQDQLLWLLSINNILSACLEAEVAPFNYPAGPGRIFADILYYKTLHEGLFNEMLDQIVKEAKKPHLQFQKYYEFNRYIWKKQHLLNKYFKCISSGYDNSAYEVEIGRSLGKKQSEPDDLMTGFIDRYRNASDYRYFLTFSWGLSSGENNLLRLFTKIRYLVDGPVSGISYKGQSQRKEGMFNRFDKSLDQKRIDQTDNSEFEEQVCDTLLLLFDEADLTYHPEWQRQLVAILTAFLPKMITDPYDNESFNSGEGCKDIQIIMTSHSPLMLGDFPAGNVIYLNKYEGITKIDESGSVNTFGQNLYTILKDSFYLERTIGEFAHKKITSVIEFINKVKALQETQRGDIRVNKELASELENSRQIVNLLPAGIIKSKLVEELECCEEILCPADTVTLLRRKRDALEKRLAEVDKQISEAETQK